MKFHSERKRKSKVSQDQMDWLMMELQSMREYNAALQNIKPSETKSAGDSRQN